MTEDVAWETRDWDRTGPDLAAKGSLPRRAVAAE